MNIHTVMEKIALDRTERNIGFMYLIPVNWDLRRDDDDTYSCGERRNTKQIFRSSQTNEAKDIKS